MHTYLLTYLLTYLPYLLTYLLTILTYLLTYLLTYYTLLYFTLLYFTILARDDTFLTQLAPYRILNFGNRDSRFKCKYSRLNTQDSILETERDSTLRAWMLNSRLSVRSERERLARDSIRSYAYLLTYLLTYFYETRSERERSNRNSIRAQSVSA